VAASVRAKTIAILDRPDCGDLMLIFGTGAIVFEVEESGLRRERNLLPQRPPELDWRSRLNCRSKDGYQNHGL
jgi:hypothetical protein